jgi:hypothetical protein
MKTRDRMMRPGDDCLLQLDTLVGRKAFHVEYRRPAG